LPRGCSVGFTTGATMANFTCLAAARGHVLDAVGWDVAADGLFGAPPVHVLIGDDAHSSVFSALKYLGLGERRVIRVPTDSMGRMRADEFRSLIRKAEGPAIVVTQAGQINTGAFDPWPEIVAESRAEAKSISTTPAIGKRPDTAALTVGCEGGFWATDGHKWLQTPYDCGYAIVRHAEAHRRASRTATTCRRWSSAIPRCVPGFQARARICNLGRHPRAWPRGYRRHGRRHCRIARRMAGPMTWDRHPERCRTEPGRRAFRRRP
jgi:glutamate/tyrosine decarboxylase-like PLP-dependent enzyme